VDIANNSEDTKGAVVGKCRKGFTTIELMIAIAILVLLMGIVLVGFGVLGNHGKATDTKVALEAAKSMLAEFEAAGAMSRVKDLYLDGSNDYYKQGIMAPDYGVMTGEAARDAALWSQIVFVVSPKCDGTTANVMRQLYSMPNNRKVLESLPGRRIAKVLNPKVKVAKNPNDSATVLLDGWGNPIIFVPAGGMRGCMDAKTGNITQPVITSVGVIQYDVKAQLPGGARPFFVSAGPDGDFLTHQDNIYSFEN
jgi:prepilin-type N-terminal cleavage/methylation domain-containing protein